MSKGLLIHNPKAGKEDAGLLPKLIAALGEVESVSMEELGGPENAPHRATESGCQWVAVSGGDGTVEAVAAALIGTDLPLGVISAGTYNNFARSLNLPLEPLEACAVIKEGNFRPIDVGRANQRPFFECLGTGLDAALYPLGEEIKSGRFSRWIDLFRRAYRYRRQKFSLTLDRPLAQAISSGSNNESRRLARRLARSPGSEITLSALMITVSNGPYFGMNFAVAPDQRMDDGLLTVTIFSRYSKLQLWWHFLSIAFGRRVYDPKSITLRVAKLHISGPKRLPVHLDGTPQKGLWPVDAVCQPSALQVFRPVRICDGLPIGGSRILP